MAGLPRVAVFFASGAAGPREIAEAAVPLCEPLLVVDSRNPWILRSLPILEAVASVLDRAALDRRAVARELRRRGVDGVTTFADPEVRAAAAAAADLGLSTFHGETVAAAVTDKAAQRIRLNEALAGANVPREPVLALGTLGTAFARLGPPAVLKPLHAEGSRFALLLESARDVKWARRALEPHAAATAGGFTLERYVEGMTHPAGDWLADYVSVESSIGSGQTVHFCVSDRPPPAWPLRETGLLLPSALPRQIREKVELVASAALAALGVTVGIVHTEIKLTLPDPAVVEVNGRLGGDVARHARRVGDFDPIAEALRLALGEPPSPTPAFHGFGATFHPVARAEATEVVELPSVARLRRIPGVWSVAPNKSPGDPVSWLAGYDDRLCEVLVEAASVAEMKSSMVELQEVFLKEARFVCEACDHARTFAQTT